MKMQMDLSIVDFEKLKECYFKEKILDYLDDEYSRDHSFNCQWRIESTFKEFLEKKGWLKQ